MKIVNKLINEHLRLNVINSNGDNVILTLDNNHNTTLGELSEYLGGMFNINPKNILYKDFTKSEVLSPTLKIIDLMILYPKLYKTLNISNMKDYHEINQDVIEPDNNEFNNNIKLKNKSENKHKKISSYNVEDKESDYQKIIPKDNTKNNCKKNRAPNFNKNLSLKVIFQFGEENNIRIKRDLSINKKIIDDLREIEKKNPNVKEYIDAMIY